MFILVLSWTIKYGDGVPGLKALVINNYKQTLDVGEKQFATVYVNIIAGSHKHRYPGTHCTEKGMDENVIFVPKNNSKKQNKIQKHHNHCSQPKYFVKTPEKPR